MPGFLQGFAGGFEKSFKPDLIAKELLAQREATRDLDADLQGELAEKNVLEKFIETAEVGQAVQFPEINLEGMNRKQKIATISAQNDLMKDVIKKETSTVTKRDFRDQIAEATGGNTKLANAIADEIKPGEAIDIAGTSELDKIEPIISKERSSQLGQALAIPRVSQEGIQRALPVAGPVRREDIPTGAEVIKSDLDIAGKVTSNEQAALNLAQDKDLSDTEKKRAAIDLATAEVNLEKAELDKDIKARDEKLMSPEARQKNRELKVLDKEIEAAATQEGKDKLRTKQDLINAELKLSNQWDLYLDMVDFQKKAGLPVGGPVGGTFLEIMGFTKANQFVEAFKGNTVEVAAALGRIAIPGARATRLITLFKKPVVGTFSTIESGVNNQVASHKNAIATDMSRDPKFYLGDRFTGKLTQSNKADMIEMLNDFEALERNYLKKQVFDKNPLLLKKEDRAKYQQVPRSVRFSFDTADQVGRSDLAPGERVYIFELGQTVEVI